MKTIIRKNIRVVITAVSENGLRQIEVLGLQQMLSQYVSKQGLTNVKVTAKAKV